MSHPANSTLTHATGCAMWLDSDRSPGRSNWIRNLFTEVFYRAASPFWNHKWNIVFNCMFASKTGVPNQCSVNKLIFGSLLGQYLCPQAGILTLLSWVYAFSDEKKQTTTKQELTFSCHSMVQSHLTIIFISPFAFVSAISLEVSLNGWSVPPHWLLSASKKARHPLQKWDRCSRWRRFSITSLAFLWSVNKHWPTGKWLWWNWSPNSSNALNISWIFLQAALLSSILVNHFILLPSVVSTSLPLLKSGLLLVCTSKVMYVCINTEHP